MHQSDIVARLGGDEFVVLLEGNSAGQLLNHADRSMSLPKQNARHRLRMVACAAPGGESEQQAT